MMLDGHPGTTQMRNENEGLLIYVIVVVVRQIGFHFYINCQLW